MTRFLSEALNAAEPYFRQGLRRLEAANGFPAHDIRLSSTVSQQTKQKLRQLGLDINDTTDRELYHTLLERIKADDVRLVKKLRSLAASQVSAEANVIDGMVLALKQAAAADNCFALKSSKLKVIISKLAPKKTMKRLGYRSQASMLKHEAPAALLAAAWVTEGERWQKQLLEQYKKLKPNDFEVRRIAVVQPSSVRWLELSQATVSASKHNLISFKELGTLVLLPFTADAPSGSVTASLALALHELNEIRAASTFLKLCQVQTDFGATVQLVATDEPRLTSELLDRSVPWQLVQRFYDRLAHKLDSSVFEPHVQPEDMSWQAVEAELARLEPSFEFWQGSHHLGLTRGNGPVSFNLIDTALNFCNQLPFERRLSHNFQQALGHELLLGYLQPVAIEKAIQNQLHPQLAEEFALS